VEIGQPGSFDFKNESAAKIAQNRTKTILGLSETNDAHGVVGGIIA